MEENSPAHEIASNVSGGLDASWCVLLGDHGGPKDAHGKFKRNPRMKDLCQKTHQVLQEKVKEAK